MRDRYRPIIATLLIASAGLTLGLISRGPVRQTAHISATVTHYDDGLEARVAARVTPGWTQASPAPSAAPATAGPTPDAAISLAPPPTAAVPMSPTRSGQPAASQPPPPPPPQPAGATPIAWGIYNPGFPGNFGAIQNAESKLGKGSAIVMWYKHWGGPYSAFHAPDFQAVLNHGSVPMVTWMSDDYSLPGYPNNSSQTGFTDARIAAGAFDPFIQSWAAGLRQLGRPVLLRLDHEMNGNWYAWSPGVNGNTAAQYVAMWRHVHDIFAREGATNVRWVWSPNAGKPFGALYPGDNYVDWVALDGYNWGMTNGWTPWQSFTTVFGQSYRDLLSLTNRPMMIAETSGVEAGAPAGTSKAAWITSMASEISRNFPRVRALIWFDQNNGNGQDFRIDSSAASLNALIAALRSPTFVSSFAP
ncbi:MAG: hypothetical protein M3Z11_08390 [Candidatus Dormibacteraeota bacterium]|nr:hypothetical protein [Candidatus Dormibacteraeota bacterium]